MIRFKRNSSDIRPLMALIASLLILSLFFILIAVGKNKPRLYQWSIAFDNAPVANEVAMKSRNVLKLYLGKDNKLIVNGETVPIDQLYDIAKEFIENPDNESLKPEKTEQVIPFFGPMLITYHHLISFRYQQSSSFEAYLSVMKELTKAYSSLRNELAVQKWQKKYASLSDEEQKAILMIYPRQISETIVSK